jgi:HAD superfamily hydrolase (TIGR01509 family)
LLGTALDASGRLLERLLDQPGAAGELAAELYELVLAEVRAGATPLPGAAELVADLRGTRPVGVASNSPRQLVEAALRAAGLADTFDAVLTGDDVERPKPAPDIYLRACELLGARPSDSIALEDSPTGVTAGRAAGLFVIGVPSLPELELDADLTAATLEDPAVRAAIARLGGIWAKPRR